MPPAVPPQGLRKPSCPPSPPHMGLRQAPSADWLRVFRRNGQSTWDLICWVPWTKALLTPAPTSISDFEEERDLCRTQISRAAHSLTQITPGEGGTSRLMSEPRAGLPGLPRLLSADATALPTQVLLPPHLLGLPSSCTPRPCCALPSPVLAPPHHELAGPQFPWLHRGDENPVLPCQEDVERGRPAKPSCREELTPPCSFSHPACN